MKKMFDPGKKWLWGTVFGLFLLLLGFFREDFITYYRKAIMICMECIGIG